MDMKDMIGKLVGGQTGMGQADDVPASIDGQTPAALSEGEFVIPADVVSAIGDGNTQAGASILQQLVDGVRTSKTGTAEQPPQIAQGLGQMVG